MNIKRKIAKLIKFILPAAASWIIAAGWSWYHIYRHPRSVFVFKAVLIWAGAAGTYWFFKAVYLFAVKKFGRHPFWQDKFYGFLDEFFFLFSLIFLVFFSQNEILSLIYVSLIFLLLYWRIRHYLSHHPGAKEWLNVHTVVFSMAYFIFLIEGAVQYSAYHYYILDSNIRFYNIVLFRAWSMTMFWIFGFAIASFIFWSLKGLFRYFIFGFWILFFISGLVFWMINIGILYFSGLYFSPVAVEHLNGSAAVIENKETLVLGILAFIAAVIFAFIARHFILSHSEGTKRQWLFYNSAIGLIALCSFFGLTSFKNTPESSVLKSFYEYYFGDSEQIKLDPIIQNKLKKFGLIYQTDDFYVNSRPAVYSATSTRQFLPDRLQKNKPNIVILFLESFSARLTGVYNPNFNNVTPNLLRFTSDPHTTIFKNYYNASTPTITGTLSQLCSFLPPTGHEEIDTERKLQSHHLLCLPEVLKKYGGFKYAAYVTAVEKEFANKDGIFKSAGVDKIFGTAELADYIKGEPLSWGYSDHQMFPQVWNFMQTAPQPFLMMLATVDTHPPFNLAKDAVNYGDGKEPVLNSFHTTDDAFGKFWDEFTSSPFYNNTIVVAVADHAIFPGELTKNIIGTTDPKILPSYYDENLYAVYVPDGKLPKTVDSYSSGLDQTPTLLQIMGINIPNSFEGHSIFDDRKNYPNLLGMHELGLYINQINSKGKRTIDYNVPTEIDCPSNYSPSSTPDLTECDYLEFYKWKRQMLEEGRFWKH